MQILPLRGSALVCFLASLLFVASFGDADGEKTVEVVGVGECADCAENNFETSQAFSGLRVTIDCKPENGEFKTRGSGVLDKEGNFRVSLPEDLVKDGKLKEECYAQLHSASAAACPAHGGLESSKIVFKSTSDGKHKFGLKGKLKFSPVTCASAFLWPHHKYPPFPKWNHPLPKFPPLKSFHHPLPKLPPHPPLKSFHHHYPIFPPIYKKPLPPPIPVYKPPPVPVYKKPLPPPVPIYKPPPVPVYTKPLPPPVPIYKPPPVPVYKKPLPPPVPIYKPPVYKPPPVPVYTKPLPPPVPVYKPPPVPVYEKPLPPPVPIYKPPVYKPPVPVYEKPLPPPVPIYKPKPLPPIRHKPLPPLPKIPPFPKKPCPPLPKLPPLPKIPPKYFHHPKFGKWPPLPPHHP
ncbi:hypothetical protein DITRI_Ditri01bG0039500 [Diplodiscus trichospermus]